jgi:glycine cleavage system H protein
MQTLQEFLLATKGNEYLIAIVFMVLFIFFWRFLNSPHYHPLTEFAVESFKIGKGIFTHPNHSWAEVLQPNLVNVGMDEFTPAVFGSIQEIELPSQGDKIYQGSKAWKIKRGERELVQTSPISGRVVEVNGKLIENPNLLNKKNPKENWILKVEPTGLARELKNLLYGETLARWNQAVKEELIAVLVPGEYPVLQEGGEIKPNLGDELTSQQWEKVTREFFNADVSKQV